MALVRVSSAQSDIWTSSIPVSATLAGDLILIFGYRSNTATSPSLPSGYTDISNAAANSNGFRLAYKISTSDSAATSVSMANSFHGISHVYRNLNATPVGDNGYTSNSSSSVTWPSLSLSDTSGASVVVSFLGHRNGTAINFTSYAPNSSSIVESYSPSGYLGSYESAPGVTSWPADAVTFSAGGNSFLVSVEIVGDAPVVTGFDHLDISNSGLINAASGSGNYLELSNSGYIRKAGTEGTNSLILDASGRIVTKGS